VTALRRLVLHHRAAFAVLVAVALLMRMLTPGGYMFALAEGTPTVVLCPGAQTAPAPMAMPGMSGHHDGGPQMPGMSGHHDGGPQRHDQGQADAPCAFAGMSVAAVAATDPLLLAVAIAFIILRAVRVVAEPRWRDTLHLRPPLRGPPIPV
jgi:hypothetical protein